MAHKSPYRIRCLKAIEAMAGGRHKLAADLGITYNAICQWCVRGEISDRRILDLLKVAPGKFTAEELLGDHDDDDLEYNNEYAAENCGPGGALRTGPSPDKDSASR